MGLFSFKKKKKAEEVPEVKPAAPIQKEATPVAPVSEYEYYDFKVAGISFREKEIIKSLGVENDDYTMSKKDLVDDGMVDEKIYKCFFDIAKVELIPEPDNPEDENAIKILCDGVHVGYVPASKTRKTKKILDSCTIESIKCEISGGKYKLLKESYSDSGKETYELITSERGLNGEVSIKYKK